MNKKQECVVNMLRRRSKLDLATPAKLLYNCSLRLFANGGGAPRPRIADNNNNDNSDGANNDK